MNGKVFFQQAGKRFFFEDAAAVAAYVKRHCPEELARVIAVADDVAAGRFRFDLRWDMERTTEYVTFDGDIDWLRQPAADPEWVYAFNRMRFWICLGQAYAATGREEYAQVFVRQMTHWISTVKKDDPACAKAWRSIEIGLRLEYWLKAICYFKGSPAVTDEAMALFLQSVAEQAEVIMDLWNDYNLMSNWGMLSNHGLFIAGVMLPASERTRAYIEESARRLNAEIVMQVYRDGTQWEQSPMYHNEVLSCYLDVCLLARRNGIALPDTLWQKTRDMCIADLYAAKPDHNEVSMGDSDEIDVRDMISRGAYIFRDSLLKFGGYGAPDYDTVWELGEEGLAAYADLAAQAPPETDHAFSDSGNFYLRSGWAEDATFLHFHCGTLGAGHGHADQLHIDLFTR
ncbi:MAG: heparinase II/III family protein, partial [Oscillospiraceae bacterium]|nr:heparinase II/III family protein [Oscillospiraceae bacterium]